MRKVFLFIVLAICALIGEAQPLAMKLQQAVQRFEQDSQMRHAIMGFVVADAKTGKVLYERNGQIGLAPASTQKIIISGAAFELLGHDFRYKTQLGYTGKIEKGHLLGHIYIKGSGDPTLGSWRYKGTRDTTVLDQWLTAVKKAGIRELAGGFWTDHSIFSTKVIPDGWIWQDIGNYYGAGAQHLNWKENQYDIILRSGNNIGDSVEVVNYGSGMPAPMYNHLKSAAKGTGDNAYIYLPRKAYGSIVLEGTIPVDEKNFSISGSVQYPWEQLAAALEDRVSKNGIAFKITDEDYTRQSAEWTNAKETPLYTHYSPPLDSINYWFMRRSINLYGEALVKTIAYEKKGFGDTDDGVALVKDFWAQHGIDKAAINIIDGSGLSPQNRVTADALVKALLFAKTRPWYASFYESIPTYNGMKLKSGSIGGARSYAGYHKDYVIAIIVNNYAGTSSEIVKKMFSVLDHLK